MKWFLEQTKALFPFSKDSSNGNNEQVFLESNQSNPGCNPVELVKNLVRKPKADSKDPENPEEKEKEKKGKGGGDNSSPAIPYYYYCAPHRPHRPSDWFRVRTDEAFLIVTLAFLIIYFFFPNLSFFLGNIFLMSASNDAAEPWQLGFQDAATPMMQGIIDLHHDIFFFLILILVFVSRILVRALWHFHYQKNPIPQRIVHGTTIEIIRTIFPSIIPMFIAIPSFALLYSMDEVVVDPAITIKAIGHQWYRTYEYSDYNSSDEQSLTFDSYTIPEDDLELGQSRLLEVDNRVVVPAKTHLRLIVTSADVPHSWAVPSLGVKCDAVPGRLNQISISVQREGVYYGQCSEICGTNHAFTPIVVEAVPSKDYGSRVSNQLIPQTGAEMKE
jgi:cytochrome c oxidase subunit 2